MSNEYETLMRCVRSVRTKTDFVPKVALVLGSGLGDYASQLRVEATVDYHEIEGFPVSTVPGHTGRFVFGYVGDVPVVCKSEYNLLAGAATAAMVRKTAARSSA